MPAQTPSAALETAPDQQDAHTRYYRATLHELIDMGADIARQVHRQAMAQPQTPAPATDPAEPLPDHTIPFDRIARAIRRTVALARHIAEPAAPAQHPDRARQRVAARTRIIRDVEDAIQRSTRGDAAETLHAELVERLDGPDLDADILHRPVDDIIADICRDLGIAAPPGARPWKRRTPADIQSLAALANRTPQAAARPPVVARPAITAQPAITARPATAARPPTVARPAGEPPRQRQRPGNDPPADLVQAGAMILRYANLAPDD